MRSHMHTYTAITSRHNVMMKQLPWRWRQCYHSYVLSCHLPTLSIVNICLCQY